MNKKEKLQRERERLKLWKVEEKILRVERAKFLFDFPAGESNESRKRR